MTTLTPPEDLAGLRRMLAEEIPDLNENYEGSRMDVADAILAILSALGLTPEVILAVARSEAVVVPRRMDFAMRRKAARYCGDVMEAWPHLLDLSPYVPAKKDDDR